MDETIDDEGDYGGSGSSNLDLGRGARELRASRDHDTDDDVEAATAAAMAASAPAGRTTTARSAVETLARALREAGAIREASEEALRRTEKDAEKGIRQAKEEAAAAAATAAAEAAAASAAREEEVAAAAEEAGRRYAADLAGVERERGALREKCAGLQTRLAEIEACVHMRGAKWQMIACTRSAFSKSLRRGYTAADIVHPNNFESNIHQDFFF